MSKVAIIGAGNVGGLTAMRILEQGIADVVLVDIIKELPKAKSLDLDDARHLVGHNSLIEGTDDFSKIKGSDIIVITAGLARKPGMTREDLLIKNYEIIKAVALDIKEISPDSIVIVVSNPVDVMTYVFIKETGFDKRQVFGMGSSLDSSRFNNLISKKLNVSSSKIDALVIGSHGNTMIPLLRFSKVGGKPLDKVLNKDQIDELINLTQNRGAEIVSLYGSGSAYFAPSAAILDICKTIIKGKPKVIPISCLLRGEYETSDVCIGVPTKLDKNGISQIIELKLNQKEKELFLESVKSIKESINIIYK